MQLKYKKTLCIKYVLCPITLVVLIVSILWRLLDWYFVWQLLQLKFQKFLVVPSTKCLGVILNCLHLMYLITSVHSSLVHVQVRRHGRHATARPSNTHRTTAAPPRLVHLLAQEERKRRRPATNGGAAGVPHGSSGISTNAPSTSSHSDLGSTSLDSQV